MAKKTKPKCGPLSICRSKALIAQIVQVRRTVAVTLEIRTLGGEVLGVQELPEPPAAHYLLPDGCSVLLAEMVRCDDDPDAWYALRLLNVMTGESHVLGHASSFHMAAAADRVAYFYGDGVVVRTLQGDTLFEHSLPYDDEHHALAFLPDGRLAVSSGADADESLADLVILNAETCAPEKRYECEVDSAYDTFSPSALAIDPQGQWIAVSGFYCGLVIFDLTSGGNLADVFAPHPLDLAEGHEVSHNHHTYGDVAFDATGAYLAATYRPGWLSVWQRDGAVVLRDDAFVNPKAERAIAFDGDAVVYLDSVGDLARHPI